MRSREPEVRIDIDAMNLIANIQAQTYYSNAIEAHLLNKPHPGRTANGTNTCRLARTICTVLWHV